MGTRKERGQEGERATAIYQVPSTCQHEAGHVWSTPHAIFAKEETEAQVLLGSRGLSRCSLLSL